MSGPCETRAAAFQARMATRRTGIRSRIATQPGEIMGLAAPTASRRVRETGNIKHPNLKPKQQPQLKGKTHMAHATTKVLLVAASAVLLTACGKSPESIPERFYSALDKSELTEAKSHLSKGIVTLMGDAKLQSVLSKEADKIKSCGGIKSVSCKLQGEGDIRRGTTTVTFGGACPQDTEKVKLVKEDGAWKITADK